MKLKLILATMATVGLASTAIAGDVAVYGKINTSVEKSELEGAISSTVTQADRWELNSNASRLGVKGSHDLGHGLKAIYKAEYEITNDDGTTFSQRNIYAGLQGNFGTVIAGRHDTPTKLLGKVVDRFNDQKIADIGNINSGETRSNNTVIYSSPRISGVKLTAAAVAGEAAPRDSLADGRSISLDYKSDMIVAGVSYDDSVQADDVTLLRAVAALKVGPAKVGLLYQDGEDAMNNEEQGWVVSAAAHASKNCTVKLQYGENERENAGGTTTAERSSLALGVDHALSDKATVYAFLAQADEDLSDTKDRTGGVGLEVKF